MANETWLAGVAGAAVAAWATGRAARRLRLSRAKARGSAGHVRMAKRLAGFIPFYEFAGDAFFAADGAPHEIAAARRTGFERLSAVYRERFAKTAALTVEVRDAVPDIDFTSRYRVPFQFNRMVRENLAVGAFYHSSAGAILTDLDGNRFYDLTGSYGVNVLGTDTYKALIAEGAETVAELGPLLGGLHPVIAGNVRRLRELSGLDAVSFHMSGTEAVMQAVRLARYHTGRTHLVRFAGAYHGWWDDVQPGVGNPLPADRTYTLADMSERTLAVLRTRKDIACVLVNPLQALHPNTSAPGDGSLVSRRGDLRAGREVYAAWLARLADACSEAGVVLIVDEIFTGFRLARRGACEYFGIRPDMITYGKTLGGGHPVGVLCGKAALMRRYREDRPADICFARGTFNSHPYVMGAMDAFLRHLETDAARTLYDGLEERWDVRAAALNARLEREALPVRVANLGTIWTVCYPRPGRFHWMLQFYLREQGLALSWVGSGRLIFNLAYNEEDFAAVTDRFVAAARAMADDGWWWCPAGDAGRMLRGRVVREMLQHVLRRRVPASA
jgi:glutamate-1-semialdehyde 2,1-aminomutase